MPDTNYPTASSRPHVTDMYYAALPTLPYGSPGAQADEALTIDPELGARIASLLSRLYHNREDVTVTKKQPGGGKRSYQVHCKSQDFHGEEGPDRPATFMVSVLHIAQFGAATRMTVTLRWVGGNCWLNLQANPTTLLTGTNAFAADTGRENANDLFYLLRYPFY